MDPFPVPKTFTCPYCGKVASAGEFSPNQGIGHFAHKVKEMVKVGRHWRVTLETIHQFEIHWVDGVWQSSTKVSGCHQMCERVELSNGENTDWHGYNLDDE